jgi:hypothetical protein
LQAFSSGALQSAPFIVFPSTPALSHRKPASAKHHMTIVLQRGTIKGTLSIQQLQQCVVAVSMEFMALHFLPCKNRVLLFIISLL